MKKHLKKIILALLILAAIGLAAYFLYFSKYEKTDDAFLEGHIVPISARVAGHVQAVLVNDNQSVAAGQALVKIDPRDLQVRLEQADAEIKALQVEAERSAGDLRRYTPLANVNEISKQQFAKATAESQKTRAQWEAAVARKKSLELELSYTDIQAPGPGKVTKKSVEVGAYISVGQNLLALVSPDLWVNANFKENQIRHMRPGQKASIYIDVLGKSYRGHVDSIQAGSGARFSLFPPENATGNFVKVVQRIPVKIVFDEPIPEFSQLGPGLSVVPEVLVK